MAPADDDPSSWPRDPLDSARPSCPYIATMGFIEAIAAWFGALKLPGRVVFGLFLFCFLMLVLDFAGIVVLGAIHHLAWPATLIGLLLFGCLSLGAAGGEGYDAWRRRIGENRVLARRVRERDESAQRRAEREATALKRLDYLSREEIRIVADALRKNEQSFLSYVHSPPVSNLMAAGLVSTPGGDHHMDYYPFYFVTFAWEAMLARRDELLAKDDENQKREAEEKRAAARR